MKKIMLPLFCLLCTACDPIVGTWAGTEYCDGPNESYCTSFPFTLQEGRTAYFSLVIAGDLTGEKIHYVEDVEQSSLSDDESKTPLKVKYESEGEYTLTIFEEENLSLSCLLEERNLTCNGTDVGMSLEKSFGF